MEPYLTPVRIVAGVVVINLRLPFRPHHMGGSARQGYVGAAIAGMDISFGCLVCVGGTLLAVLLLYAGASSSPVSGGFTLFLFAMGMSLPFPLAAMAFDKVLPRFIGARRPMHLRSTPAPAGQRLPGPILRPRPRARCSARLLPGR